MLVTLKSFNALKAECETLKTELATAKTAPPDVAEALKVAADLQTQVATLTAERDTARTEAATAATALADLQAKFDDLTAKAAKLATDKVTVDQQAKVIALEIAQSQGIPPVGAGPAAVTTETNFREQYLAITDHAERAAFWAKHRDAILPA